MTPNLRSRRIECIRATDIKVGDELRFNLGGEVFTVP